MATISTFGFPIRFFALVVTASLAISPAIGQGIFRPMSSTESGRFIEAPRLIEQQLKDAERALQEKRYSDAVVRLGDLLSREAQEADESDLGGQDFFIGAEEIVAGVPIQMSLLRAARNMIGELPSAAMETYELRYGSIARKLLTDAAENRDWEQVRLVRRKYFHTQAGYEASWLLAQRDIYLGHPLSASILLDDVVIQPRAIGQLGVGVAVQHAAACQLSGRPLPTIAVGDVTINGKPQTIPAGEGLSAWLSEHSGLLQPFAPEPTKDYPMFGSSANRNGDSAGQMPLTNLRWMLTTTASPRQERKLRGVTEELTSGGKLPPPTWMPIRVGDQLLMRTTERLVGVNYRTGKRVWTYPWQSANDAVEDEELSFDELTGEEGATDLLSQRVWNDVPYGHITSDGERAFMLDDLGEVEMVSFSPMINLRGTRPADTSTNTLVALEMATEGKLLWRLGAGADENSPLSDAFFLGPPLPIDGRLYVMVEIGGDINLSCLDPATGAEIWRQHLVAVESGGIEGDPIRRVAGAVPTYHEGVLICPTGAGATVAIDLADQMFRWGVTYDRNTEMSRTVSGRGTGVEATQLMQRWDNGIAIADGTSVLVTPIEADRLFGFDLLTGASLFPEKNRVHMRYLAGIRGNRFIVVGGNQVRAFELDRSGTAVWTAREMLSAGQQIAGRGVFGDNCYFVPTSTNQLVQISLDDGSVIDRRNTRYPLGNLVAVDGEIIVQGPTSLAVAFGETTLEPIVNRMLADNPDDFEGLVRKSELLIQRGQRTEALEFLTRARDMQPDNDEVHMLSVSAMLGLLRDDADVDAALIETLDDLIDRPAQRVELLSLRVRAALRKNDNVEAVKRLLDLSSLLITEPMLETIADQVVNDPTRQCSLDSWVAGRANQAAIAATPDETDEINQLVRLAVSSRRDASTNLLDRLHRHFRCFDGAEDLRDELVERFKTAGEPLRIERLLLGTRVPRPDVIAQGSIEDAVAIAGIYANGGLHEDAIAVLDAIGDDKLKSNDGDSSAKIEQEKIEQIRTLAQSRISEPQWPDKASLSWDSRQLRTRFGSTSQRVSKTEILAGKKFNGWQLISDASAPIALRDPSGMPRVIPIESSRQGEDIDKEAQISGGAMMVLMPSGLALVDLYHMLAGDGESVAWQRGLSGDGSPIAKRRGVPTAFGDQVIHYYLNSAGGTQVIPEFKLGPVLGDRVVLLQGGDLFAVDLMNKETLWRNSNAPVSGVIVCDETRAAVVSPATSEVAFFDLLDGRKLTTKPWQYGDVWESIGRHVLCYQRSEVNGDEFTLTLIDPLADDADAIRLSTTTHSSNRADRNSPASFGRIVDGRYLAMMESSGDAFVWDLAEGREIGRVKLPPFDDLSGLHAMILRDKLFFLPKRMVDPPLDQSVEQLQTEDGTFHRMTHGVYCVSMADGSLLWGETFDKPWGCTLTQASDTPVLMLTRSPFTYSIPSRKKFLDVLGLDVRNGAELVKKTSKPIQPSNNELEVRLTVQTALSQVIAQIGPEFLTFKFGDIEQATAEPDDEAETNDVQ